MIESVTTGAFDPRVSYKAQPLGSEIAFASGMTGMSTGPFISWGAYEKNATLEEVIAASMYVQRLMGYYAERGAIITTDLHGWIRHRGSTHDGKSCGNDRRSAYGG